MKKALLILGLLLCVPIITVSQQTDPHDGQYRGDSIDLTQEGLTEHAGDIQDFSYWQGFIAGEIVVSQHLCAVLQGNVDQESLFHRQRTAENFIDYSDIPSNVTMEEANLVITKYIHDTPTTLHEPPDITILNALHNAYPCVVTK